MCCCTIPAALPLKFEAFIREAFPFHRHLADFFCIYQGVTITKRCRLSWLTNSAAYLSPNAGGGRACGGLSQWVQLYTEAQINFGDIAPYLTFGINIYLGVKGTRWRKQLGPLLLFEYSMGWTEDTRRYKKTNSRKNQKNAIICRMGCVHVRGDGLPVATP